VTRLGRREVNGMGGGNGCLLGGGESVRDRVVFAFFFCGREGRGPCSLRHLIGFSFFFIIHIDIINNVVSVAKI